MKTRLRLLLAACVASLAFAACADEGGDTASTPDAVTTGDTGSGDPDSATNEDTGPAQDTGGQPDVATEDAGSTDTGPVEPDTGGGPDVTEDTAAPLCPEGQTECLGDDGLSDPSLCPNLTEFDCIEGCCVPKFKCATDEDCAPLAGTEDCPDPRFDCRCTVDTGKCHLFVCDSDAACDAGEICASGVCQAAPAAEELLARITSRGGTVTDGTSIDLYGEAYDADDPTVVVRGVELEWASDNEAAVTVAAGASGMAAATGHAAGVAGVTVRVKGGTTWSAPVTVSSVGAPTGTRVIVVDSNTKEPVDGAWIQIEDSVGATASGQTVGGVFESADVTPPMDVHVFSETHAHVSAYAVGAADVLVVTPPTFRAKLYIEEDGAILPENQQIEGEGSIITGEPDFSQYTKTGEIELGITSLGIGDAVFSFDLPLIIGPDVERYYHPEAPSIFASGGQQNLPGGVTFEFAGPVLVEYWLAGLPGQTSLWTLAGRVASNDPDLFPKISEILGSVDDGINFETLLSALFPLFKTFYSGVNRFLTLEQVPTYPPPVVNSVLTMPLTAKVAVPVPTLPSFGELGWADLALAIGGAITPDGQMTPLGITAAADKPYKEAEADGMVDGDPITEDVIEPLDLRMAPAHSGLQGETTELAVLVVAAALNVDGDSEKPESGSAYLARSPMGATIGAEAAAPAEGFLPISLGTTFGSAEDEADRTLKLEPIAGADFHRVVFRSSGAQQWFVYLPAGVDEVTIPDPKALAETLIDPAGAEAKTLVVNAFELEDGAPGLDALLAPGGANLDALMHIVRRASYVSQKNN